MEKPYSSANRLVSATDPLGMTETWSYDAGGRMLTHTEAAGNVKSLTYDSLSRVTMVSYVQGAMAQQASSVAFAYDRNGNRTSMTDSNGATNYTYDALNRPTAISFPPASFPLTGATVSYSYDCNDNRTAMAYGGKTISYTYDANNRMSAVSDGTRTTSYSYDSADNLLSISYPNGGSVGYSYDDAGRISARQLTSGQVLMDARFRAAGDDAAMRRRPLLLGLGLPASRPHRQLHRGTRRMR